MARVANNKEVKKIGLTRLLVRLFFVAVLVLATPISNHFIENGFFIINSHFEGTIDKHQYI